MFRLFFALPIDIDFKQRIIRAFHNKKSHCIRFTPEENLHITIHFLGSTEERKLEEIFSKASAIAANFPSFELKFENFRLISKEKKPLMIWAQFEENPAFEKLSFQLREAFPTGEKRKPNPHATIARIKQLKRLPFELPAAKPFSFIADRLELWESKLNSEGSKYFLLKNWNLKR